MFPQGLAKPPDPCPQAQRSHTAPECEALSCLEAPANALVLTLRGCQREADPAEQPEKSRARGPSAPERIKSHPKSSGVMGARGSSVLLSRISIRALSRDRVKSWGQSGQLQVPALPLTGHGADRGLMSCAAPQTRCGVNGAPVMPRHICTKCSQWEKGPRHAVSPAGGRGWVTASRDNLQAPYQGQWSLLHSPWLRGQPRVPVGGQVPPV